jgi:hypothetical protein
MEHRTFSRDAGQIGYRRYRGHRTHGGRRNGVGDTWGPEHTEDTGQMGYRCRYVYKMVPD